MGAAPHSPMSIVMTLMYMPTFTDLIHARVLNFDLQAATETLARVTSSHTSSHTSTCARQLAGCLAREETGRAGPGGVATRPHRLLSRAGTASARASATPHIGRSSSSSRERPPPNPPRASHPNPPRTSPPNPPRTSPPNPPRVSPVFPAISSLACRWRRPTKLSVSSHQRWRSILSPAHSSAKTDFEAQCRFGGASFRAQ
ncbi:hypothetical protein T492DRAFT_95138 [Pavlovales sp. CCMP2436]|nr:hypothetical protein T492DRAFT_95138 [Pavlovales sp. CCMP2436]